MGSDARSQVPVTMAAAFDKLSFRPASEADMPFLLELRRRTMTDHQLASGVQYLEHEQRERVLDRFECAQIVLLAGATPNDLHLVQHAQTALAPLAGRVAITELAGLPLEEIKQRAARLPEDSLVLALTLYADGTGRTFVPQRDAIAFGNGFGERLDLRDAIRAAAILVRHAELFDPAQHDVVAAVVERLGMRDDAGTANRVDRRPALVVSLVARPQQHHADNPIAAQRVAHHLAISRLEDVQRQKHVWKQDNVR